MRPLSFLKDVKSSSASFGRLRMNISLRQSRYTNLRAPGTKKREGSHQEAFTILIMTTITNARMPASTMTMPNNTQRKLGGFFDGGGSSMTTC